MPILTRPAFAKGSANEITLNKADLALEVSDLYFGDPANWKQVVLFYETSTGKQRKALIYDASQASPVANFDISERARDQWDIKKVAIYDFDGGSLTINRGDLTVAEFDIVLGQVQESVLPIVRSFSESLGGSEQLLNTLTQEPVLYNPQDGFLYVNGLTEPVVWAYTFQQSIPFSNGFFCQITYKNLSTNPMPVAFSLYNDSFEQEFELSTLDNFSGSSQSSTVINFPTFSVSQVDQFVVYFDPTGAGVDSQVEIVQIEIWSL